MRRQPAASGLGGFAPPPSDRDLSADLFRQISEHLPGVLFVVAPADGRIVYANVAAHRAARRAAGELVGCLATAVFAFVDPVLLLAKTPAEVRAVADRDGDEPIGWDVSYAPLATAEPETAAVLITAVDVTHHEIAKARTRAAQGTLGPIRDADGRVTGAVMAWQDVGELQRAQAAVRESEQRLRAVLLQVPAAIFIVEAPDARVTFKSRLVDDVLGAPDADLDRAKASLRGWALHKDGSPYELSEYPSRRALAHGETVHAEPMTFSRGDGRLIDLEMYAGPVHGETGEIVAAVAVAMDVTERRQAEARQAFLFRLQDSLRALSKPTEILAAAATLLGRHLEAGRIGYSEMQPDDETLRVTDGYVDGAPPVNGLFSWAKLGPQLEEQMRRGQTLVYEDVQAADQAASPFHREMGTRAHVSVPRIREGRFTGSLYVTHFKRYAWTPAEVELIEDVAARIWDAAERGRAEARLRESEERLRLALESSGLGSWEYDATTKTTVRSPRHDAIFGYTEPVRDWSYERFKGHIPVSDRAQFDGGFRAALEQGEDWDVECRMVRVDGSPGWLKVRARPRRGGAGEVMGLLGTVADITERKQAEATVLETAAKFESFAQTMPSMVWTSLPDGQIDWFNARVSEYSGIPAGQMKPDGWAPVHPDDVDRATRSWRDALASGEPYETEYRIRRHDGMFRWHITRAVPIRGADGAIAFWIGTSADIQDQKSSEQALAELNATLEEQVRARTAELLEAEATLRQSQKMEAVGQLTGGLAHDFNNLLAGITGSMELLANRLAQGKVAELDRYVHVAQEAAKRAAALTHRLLAFSRRQTLDPKPTDVNQLVAGMDDLIRRTVGPSVTVQVHAASALWPVLVDPNQLENALLNLCINARDAMPDGGRLSIETANQILRESEASALELSSADYVSLSVADTGGGMAADVVARAFEPFFTTKPLGEGTGLGLSMVYGFTRQSGGQARIDSNPGQGAKVSLYLPRYAGPVDVVEPPADSPQPRGGTGQTVLVVDDEPSLRLIIHEALGELGYTVLEAETGASALQVLASMDRADLLVTDVGLPGGMNGRQLADAAMVTRPDLKVLFITGYAKNAVIGDGRLQPGMHVLTKPFSLETLCGRVKDILATSAVSLPD